MKKIGLLGLLLFSGMAPVFGQIGCPAVIVPDTNVCGGPCVDITAQPISGALTDSYQVAPVPYSPYPFSSAGGNPILLNIDDTWSSVVNLPFNFCFFGGSYNQMIIGSNGCVSFDLTNAGGYNTWPIGAPIPDNTVPDMMNSIMAPWHDIDPSVYGDIYWHMYGSYPCRVMVITWDSVAMFSCNSDWATAQLALYETTNIIEVYVHEKPVCAGWNDGAAILGIQNATGTQAYWASNYNYPTQWTAQDEGWAFIPNGAPNYTLTWYEEGNPTPLATTPTLNVCPAASTPTNYIAEVVYNNCGAGTVTVRDTATVVVYPSTLSASASGTDALCFNTNTGTVTVTPSGGTAPFTYEWSTGGTTQTLPNVPAGSYFVTVTDAGGCTSVANVSIGQPSALTVAVSGHNESCVGNLDGWVEGHANGGTAPYTFTWSNGATTDTANGISAGTYTLTVTDANGCTTTASTAITSNPLPVANAGADLDQCDNLPGLSLNGSGAGGSLPYAYAWSCNQPVCSISDSTFATPWANPALTTTYYLVLTDANGCVSLTDSMVFTIHPNPVADFDITPSCFLDTTRFTDLSTLASGAISGWDWDFGDGNGATTQNSSHVYLVAGTYPVTLIVTSDFGCGDTLTIPYDALPAPEIPVPQHDTVCPGYAAQLYVPQPDGFIVEWYYDANSTLPFHYGPYLNIPPYFAPLMYWVDFLTPEGCHSIKVPIVASLYPVPAPMVTIEPRVVEIPNALVEFGMTNSGGLNVWWTFGDGGVSAAHNTAHQYTEPGFYTITLHVENEYGCEEMYTYPDWVEVIEIIRLYAPNAFSPNGDGLNDEFWVTSRLVTDLSIQIYDRWGRQIYASDNLNFHWDGRDPKGADLPEGVYTYSIQAVGFDGVPFQKSGTITLLK